MRHFIVHILFFVSLLIGAQAAMATDEYDWYFGPSLGLKRLEADCCQTQHPVNIGFVGGVILENRIGFEAEVTDSIDSGEFLGLDMDVQTVAAFVTYQSLGKYYYKIKMGAVRGELQINNLAADGDGMAYGIGMGFEFDFGHRMELEYTVEDFVDEGDLGFLSLSYLF